MATKMSLKLLVDKKRNKVLFAESGKDFVDFLFSLLTLPVGTIVRLLTPTQTTTGCIGNLYSSVNNLDNIYMQPNVDKSPLLQPTIGSSGDEMKMLLMHSDSDGSDLSMDFEPKKQSYYGCYNRNSNTSCRNYVTNEVGASCGNCGGRMNSQLYFVKGQGSTTVGIGGGGGGEGGGGGGGYVKEVVTYMITDDLEVKPMSTISSIAILNRLDVKDIGALEDRIVHLGTEEALNLLKASLQTKSVLTNIFLKKEIKFEPCSSSKTYPTL